MFASNHPHLKNSKLSFLLCVLSLLIFISISGCVLEQQEQLYSKDEAESKFIQACKDEYKWDVKTRLIGNTFWIYLPYEEEILKFRANKFPQTSKFSVTFLEGSFIEDTFTFEYQIMPILKSEENKGYTYSLTDKVSEDFHYLLNLIYRVYFNTEQQPEFYVIVLADVVNGVEAMYTVYGLDLKKAYNNAMAQEEYYKRIVQDIRGNLKIINDRIGRHLHYGEIKFGQFLTEQITQRIRIRFLSGDFELKGTTEEEILKIISYCVQTYEFQNFFLVTLKNLSTEAQITESRLDLKEIKEL